MGKVYNTFSDFTSTLPLDGNCYCGSTKKYENCCKEKVEKYESLIEIRNAQKNIEKYLKSKNKQLGSHKVYQKALLKKNLAFCIAEEIIGECEEKKIVFAHTLGKSSVLKKMDRVVTFNRFVNFPLENVNDYFEKINHDKASIVNLYCSSHDKFLFKDIENGHEFKGGLEQHYQMALNSISIAFYAQILQIMVKQKLLNDLIDFWMETQLKEDYEDDIERLFTYFEIIKKVLFSIKTYPKEKNVLFTFHLEIKNIQLPFVLSETLEGWKGIEEVFVNIIPDIKSSWIILSSFDRNAVYLFEELKEYESNIEYISGILVEILSVSSNIYFKEEYIKKLSDFEKAMFVYKFTKNGAIRISNHLKYTRFYSYSENEIDNIFAKLIQKSLI